MGLTSSSLCASIDHLLFACCLEFVVSFPLFLLLCCPGSSVVVFFTSLNAFRCFGFLWCEEVVDLIFPSFFFGFPTALHVLIWVLRLGFHSATFFPNALLAAMLFASLIATSFFYVCFGPASDFGCIHPFFRSKCASFYVLDPVLLLNFLPCRFLHLYRLRRNRRCLGRKSVLESLPLHFRLQSCDFLFLLRHHPSRSQVVCHSQVLFPPCCSVSSSCTSFTFGQ